MPQATLPGTFDAPPSEIQRLNPALYDYLYMLHVRLFGGVSQGGGLDDTNIAGFAHGKLTGVTAYQHHGSDAHASLVQAAALTDAAAVPAATSGAPAASAVAITTADASAVYGVTEQTLLNELKADVNALVTDLNAAVTVLTAVRADGATARSALVTAIAQLNSLLTRLRTAALLASS